MAPNVLVVIFFIWTTICYGVGLFAPWTYLSFKNAYGDNLGITEEGTSYVPTSIQNMTCTRRKAEVYVWSGVCESDSCTGFENNNAWEAIDLLNAEYDRYYKHAIYTDYAGDRSKWNTVQSLVVASFFVVMVCFLSYLYGGCYNEAWREDTASYTSFALVFTSGASVTAVVVSLGTYCLGHQFFTGGAYYVKGWLVYSEFYFGCEGPQYLPGPGIVMQCIGGLTAFLLALILPCQCIAPPQRQDEDFIPVAMASPLLLEESIQYMDE